MKDHTNEYWRRRFPGPIPLVSLPLDSVRPPFPGFLRQSIDSSLPSELNADLRSFASLANVSPALVILAAAMSVLHRWSGQDIIAVGALGLGGEDLSKTNELLLPVQFDWTHHCTSSSREVLESLEHQLHEALSHSDLTVEDLADLLGTKEDAYGKRLCNVAFCRQSVDEAIPLAVPALSSTLTGCDLVFVVSDLLAGVQISVDFDSEILEEVTVQRLLSHLQKVLNGIVRNPRLPFLALPMLSDVERERIVKRCSAGKSPEPTLGPKTTLHNLFEQQACLSPEAAALSCGSETINYRDLNERADHIAAILRATGIRQGAIIGICLERSLDLVISILAVLKSGAAYLPLDPAYPAERIAFMLDDSGAAVVLSHSGLADKLPASVGRVLCVDELPAQGVMTAKVFSPASHAEDPAYVIYTSGTTGKPKGVVISHFNVVRLFTSAQPWFHFSAADVWSLFHSCSFDFSVWEIWGALLHGGRLVVVPFSTSRSPDRFLDLILRERVTILNQTPSAFRQLVEAVEFTGATGLALRYVIFGGEALDMDSLRPWFDRFGDEAPQLVNMYGITETTVHVTYRPLSRRDMTAGSVIGVPIPDLSVFLLDPHGEPVPDGVIGELYVGGAGLSSGYLNRPELTKQRFVRNHLVKDGSARLYRSGDLARLLPSGDLEYLGRADKQVKIRGFRIELGEIESALNELEPVRRAVVTARRLDTGGCQMIAYLVPIHQPVSIKDVRDALKRKLPDYMIPALFIPVDEIPMTTNGKVDWNALPDPEKAVVHDHVPSEPKSKIEGAVADVWMEVIKIASVGLDDNFFEAGGDSVAAVQVQHLLRDRLRRDVDIVSIFQFPTIRLLAGHLTACPELAGKNHSTMDRAERILAARRRKKAKRE